MFNHSRISGHARRAPGVEKWDNVTQNSDNVTQKWDNVTQNSDNVTLKQPQIIQDQRNISQFSVTFVIVTQNVEMLR